jgi:predicted kinase
MPTAHLVFGFLGSGKTTLAKRLELEHNAVRFTPDEWMARLFGEDPPADTFQNRAAVILDLIQPIWVRCLSLGLDVVLDYGFWSRAERDRARSSVESIGATHVLWAVSCSDDDARKRIALRNEATHRSLYIAPPTYDLLKTRVEPLDVDELHIVAGTTGSRILNPGT